VLAGLRVVELSGGFPAAVVAMWLAEFGADVLKVEPPGGDRMRADAPAAFASWNRSKRSGVADLDDPAQRRWLDEELAHADVLLHSCTPATATERGLHDDQLAVRFPALLVASVTGYAWGHEDVERPASELLVQARLGLMDEQPAGRPGPMAIRMPVASWGAAHLLLCGLAARLVERERTGRARAIHTSLQQGALLQLASYWHRVERFPAWMSRGHTVDKSAHPASMAIYECADGKIIEVIRAFDRVEAVRAVAKEHGFDQLGSPWVPEEAPRWAALFRLRSSREWLDLLWESDIPAMPVLDVGEVLGTEQSLANRYSVEVQDPGFGATVQAGHPVEIDPPAAVRWPAPALDDGAVGLPPVSGDPAAGQRTAGRTAVPGVTSRYPLEGMHVADFGAFLAGPLAAELLGMLGAEVFKIERPGGEKGREIIQFLGCSRGKRSMVLDLRDVASRPVFEAALRWSDVVVHNVRPEAAKRLGIDPASVAAVNPTATVAASTAYGSAGPWRDLPAYDPTALALSGWERGNYAADQHPRWMRTSSMDCLTGAALAGAVLLSTYYQARTGVNSPVSTSLLAVAVLTSSETVLTGPERAPAPIARITPDLTGTSPFERIYEADDAWLAVSATTAEQRAALVRVLLPKSPAGDAAGEATAEQLARAVRYRPVSDLLIMLGAAGVPAERVRAFNRDAFFDRELSTGSGLVARSVTDAFGVMDSPSGYWSDAAGVIPYADVVAVLGDDTEFCLAAIGNTADRPAFVAAREERVS
jgi:crotonobetainyl-CoA:carnitine CoA-transferase CaiB-like acyl-CoA transferase